ncbi:MAG: hypothetical protein IPI19_18790 [Ignavibacteriales bacterium]|nr:hypothetical protein [Ignavibacteriales bacterium]
MIIYVFFAIFFSKRIFSQSINELSRSTNRFAFNLYEKVIEKKNSNIFFSPIGLSTAFAQVYIGSNNNTKNEISKFIWCLIILLLSFQMNFSFSNQLFSPEANSIIELLNANSVWVNNKFELKPEFAKYLKIILIHGFTLDVSKPSECAIK